LRAVYNWRSEDLRNHTISLAQSCSGPGVNPARERVAIIIVTDPARLTAAYELLKRTDIKPVFPERSEYMGRSTVSQGNRVDTGGHRFSSKPDR